MWEITLALCLRILPYFHQVLLQTAKSLFFRDTGIGNTVIMIL